MAKSYFSYVEREADSYVNWADVGRTITNTVDEIDRTRTEKKAAIDAAYKEGLMRINEEPQGENRQLNEFAINLGYTQAEQLKIQHNLLKSGKIPVKDFAIFLQNQTDDIKSIYSTLTNVQTVFKEKQDRMKAGISQGIEVEDAIQLEKYGNLTDLQDFSNLNGKLSFGITEEVEIDGQKVRKVKPGGENILSVDKLVGSINRKYDKYDYLKDADGFITRLGDALDSYRQLGETLKAGSITQIVDKTGQLSLEKAAELNISKAELARLQQVVADYNAAESDYIKSALDNPYNKSSILTENLQYKATFNKEEADKDPKKYMYAEKNASGVIMPQFTPEQEKAAEEFLRKQYRQMIDKKLDIKTYTEVGKQQQEFRAETPQEYSGRLDEQMVSEFGNIIVDLWRNGGNDRDRNLESLRGSGLVEDMYFEKGKGKEVFVIIRQKGGEKETKVKMVDENGEEGDIKEFGRAIGSWTYGNQLVTTYLNKFDKTLEAGRGKFNPNFSKGSLDAGAIRDLKAQIGAIELQIANNEKEGIDDWGVSERRKERLQKQLDALQGGRGGGGGGGAAGAGGKAR